MLALCKTHPSDLAIGFECNPKFIPGLTELAKSNAFSLYNACVWTSPGKMDLHLDEVYADAAGTSLLAGHDRARAGKVTSVDTVDFLAMLSELVRARDRVVVKMDVEGAEYPLLKAMLMRPGPAGAFLDSGELGKIAAMKEGDAERAMLAAQKPILCLIDILYIEEHQQAGLKPKALGGSAVKEIAVWLGDGVYGCGVEVRSWA